MRKILSIAYVGWLALWHVVPPGHYHHTDLQQALADADRCPSPVSWAERDEFGEWFAVCATADGRVCGDDVPEDDPECLTPENQRCQDFDNDSDFCE